MKLGTIKKKGFLETDDPLYDEFKNKYPKLAENDFGTDVFILLDLQERKQPYIKGKQLYYRFIYSVLDVIFETATNKPKRYLTLKTTKSNPELYQHYDNYDAINCNKTTDFPIDYRGRIGLPITSYDLWLHIPQLRNIKLSENCGEK